MAQEVCCAGSINDLNTLLKGFRSPPGEPTLALLERQPTSHIAPGERQALLHFAPFERAFDFTPYTSGRIFHAEGEVRWERQADTIQVVYTGQVAYQPEFKVTNWLELDAYTDRSYYLFGKRLDADFLKNIGQSAQAGDFAEARIPRLLRYPIVTEKERVQLVACEYSDRESGAGVAFRFKKLVEAEERHESV